MLRLHLHKGVTLLEVLVALAVSALLFAVGVPALGTLVLDARRTAHVNRFVAAVHLAKGKAHEQRTDVVLCPSAEGNDCDGAADWNGGWLLFINRDQDHPPRVDGGERILLRVAGTPHGTVSGNRTAFVFRPFNVSSTNGTVTFCDRRGPEAARAVIVSATGRPRASARSASGAPLECPH